MFNQIFRNKTGAVRTYWNLFIVAFSVLGIIVFNRIILRVTGLLTDTTEPQIIPDIMDLIAVTGLIYVLTTRLDQRDFSWSEVGLSWKPTVLIFFCGGVMLGLILEVLSIGLGVAQGTFKPSMTSTISSVAVLTGTTSAMFNSFWQEIAFRGYLQTRFVESYGAQIGIPVVAVTFVLLHLVVKPLSPLEVLAGSILFLFVGLLYFTTKNLYLVGALHGTLNYIPSLLETWSQPSDRVIVYELALGLMLLYTRLLSRNRYSARPSLL
jgi:membrane protease YdiL (CAAX protease family)